jgi:hypothetical protein
VVILSFKDKEHPLVLPQMFSALQSMVPLFRSPGDLHPDFLVMEVKRNFQEAL